MTDSDDCEHVWVIDFFSNIPLCKLCGRIDFAMTQKQIKDLKDTQTNGKKDTPQDAYKRAKVVI